MWRRFAWALGAAVTLAVILMVPGVVVTLYAADYHPLVCHNLDQYTDWFWWFWYECYLPHGPECAVGG